MATLFVGSSARCRHVRNCVFCYTFYSCLRWLDNHACGLRVYGARGGGGGQDDIRRALWRCLGARAPFTARTALHLYRSSMPYALAPAALAPCYYQPYPPTAVCSSYGRRNFLAPTICLPVCMPSLSMPSLIYSLCACLVCGRYSLSRAFSFSPFFLLLPPTILTTINLLSPNLLPVPVTPACSVCILARA